MKHLISFALAIILICTCAVPALAATVETAPVQPRFTHILNNAVSISIDEDWGIVTAASHCQAQDLNDTVIVTCVLERVKDGEWETLYTWSNSGIGFADIHQSRAVLSGYYYRVSATYYITDENGVILETSSGSASKYFPKK